MSEILNISTPDGDFSALVVRPSKVSQDIPTIVILQEIFGINPNIRQTAQEFAERGFIVICPDLFWRQTPNLQLSEMTDWDQALKLYAGYELTSGVADIVATMHAARSLRGGNGKVGVMGFCLGGLMTYLTGTRAGFDAGAWYHGGRTEEFLSEAKNLTNPIVMHVGSEDEFIPPAAQEAIAKAVRDNPKVEMHIYMGCAHAFARHGGTKYDAEAAKIANHRTVEFFKKHLN